jgi:hypothetical protein
MNKGSLDVSFRSFGGVTARFSVGYPSGGTPVQCDLTAGLYATLEDLAAEMHMLLQAVDANLSCSVAGDVITVASAGWDFDLFVTSLTLKAWLGLTVPALGMTSVSGRSPMRFLTQWPWGDDRHTIVRYRRSAQLDHLQVGAVTLSTAREHRWTLTLDRAELARFRFVAAALLRGLPGYCRPDISSGGGWEWDARTGGFPCVAAPEWQDYSDSWQTQTAHLVVTLPIILREVP